MDLRGIIGNCRLYTFGCLGSLEGEKGHWRSISLSTFFYTHAELIDSQPTSGVLGCDTNDKYYAKYLPYIDTSYAYRIYATECSRRLAGLGEDLLLKEGIEVEGDTLPVEEGPRAVMNYIGIPVA